MLQIENSIQIFVIIAGQIFPKILFLSSRYRVSFTEQCSLIRIYLRRVRSFRVTHRDDRSVRLPEVAWYIARPMKNLIEPAG